MITASVAEELVRPIAPDRPCGDDLEDTPLLASFDAFRLFGHTLPYETAPEWTVIASRAAEALCRSRDLRLLAHLGAALLRTDGLPAFAGTLTIASQWLQAHWLETFPRVDDDAMIRRNALNCFADLVAVVDGVRRLPLASSPKHGTVSLRDIEIANGVLPDDGDGRMDEVRIEAAFATTSHDEMVRLLESVDRSLRALTSIETRMREDAGSDMAPAFDALSSQLTKVGRVLRAHLPSAAANGEADAEAGERGAVTAAPAPVGAVRSREDAIRALDAVAEFFRQQEPSSPIPLIVDRAKRLVAKSFLEVLDDIAPGAVAQARAAGGLKDG